MNISDRGCLLALLALVFLGTPPGDRAAVLQVLAVRLLRTAGALTGPDSDRASKPVGPPNPPALSHAESPIFGGPGTGEGKPEVCPAPAGPPVPMQRVPETPDITSVSAWVRADNNDESPIQRQATQ